MNRYELFPSGPIPRDDGSWVRYEEAVHYAELIREIESLPDGKLIVIRALERLQERTNSET